MTLLQERIDELWGELVQASMRISLGPISDRRTAIAYRDGLITAYSIITFTSDTKIRERLIGIEASR